MQSNTDLRSRPSDVRKRLLPNESATRGDSTGKIDLTSHAILAYTSDDPGHPIEDLVDRHIGRGGHTVAISSDGAAIARCSSRNTHSALRV